MLAFHHVGQGFLNLGVIFLCLVGLYYFFMGAERKRSGDQQHPFFQSLTRKIPNIMSFVRFPLGAWIFIIHFLPSCHNTLGFLSLHFSFWAVALLDILDGQFARKWNAITEEGKSLDPASDKVVTFCLALTAFAFGDLSNRWWVLAVIVVREVGSMVHRAHLRKKGIDVSARWLGKIKTVVQFTVLYILLLRIPEIPGTILLDQLARMFSPSFILWLLVFMCFITVISFFPFFESFAYVNAYQKSQRAESERPWYIVCIPNLFTLGNYFCGVTAVFFAMPEINVAYRPFVILFWVFAAALFDAFDGPLARKLRVHSDFGACLDSSTDLSTFGLATGLALSLQLSEMKGNFSLWGAVVGIVYFTYVHLRLARFSIRLEEKEDSSEKGDFLGLPSPAGAFAVLLAFTLTDNAWVLSLLVIAISLLMYSKLNFISHSNAVRTKLYRGFIMPLVILGFGILTVLLFQQPFVSMHTSRELKDYFAACAYLLTVPMAVYILDACRRTFISKEG